MFNRQTTIVLQANLQSANNVSIGNNGGILAANNGNNQAIGQSASNVAVTNVVGNTAVF